MKLLLVHMFTPHTYSKSYMHLSKIHIFFTISAKSEDSSQSELSRSNSGSSQFTFPRVQK